MIKYSIKNNGNISRRKEDCIDDAIIAYVEIYDCGVSICGPFVHEFKEPVKSTRKQAMELVKRFEKELYRFVDENYPEISKKILSAEDFSSDLTNAIVEFKKKFVVEA